MHSSEILSTLYMFLNLDIFFFSPWKKRIELLHHKPKVISVDLP